MKAVILKNKKGYHHLRVSEVNKPKVGEYDVLIKIKYAGINYAEILSSQGLYNWAGEIPYILGIEGSGVIEQTGNKVTKYKMGDRVVVAGKTGTYAEYNSRHEDLVFPMPNNFSYEEAAALPGNWLTAWIAIFSLARCKKEEIALIQSAAGGVGLAACKLCLSLGMKVYGTSSSQKKKDYLDTMGVIPLDYSDFDQLIKPNFILESVGGDIHKRSLKCLAPLGKIVSIGASCIKIKKCSPLSWVYAIKDFPKISRKELDSQGYMVFHTGHLFERNLQVIVPEWHAMMSYLLKHNIKPTIQKNSIYPMSKIAEAFEFIDHRKNLGKVLLDPSR